MKSKNFYINLVVVAIAALFTQAAFVSCAATIHQKKNMRQTSL